jgi:N-methylhydantoinase A
MQCGGGVMPAEDAARAPLLTLDSGPVGGLIATKYLAEAMGCPNIIATDMGGTSFDVGLIHDGLPVSSYVSVADQYRYFVPRLDIKSVGSGGGSVVWIDELSGTLRVGPRSAGADPGPACYGRGGVEPTVTDADLLLGYLDPEYFLGGRIKLDRAAAELAISGLAKALDRSPIEVAAGVAKIVEFQMADLVRKVTIQKGYDPRDFVLFAYGGAGPVHAAVYARELGVQSLIVPLGDICSVWSALGAASSDVLHIFDKVDILDSPFDPARVNANFAELEEKGLRLLRREEVPAGQIHLVRSVDMRYRAQIHQVEVSAPEGRLGVAELAELIDRFEERYELLYGKGSGYRSAGVQIESFRVRAIGRTAKPAIVERPLVEARPPAAAAAGRRDVFWAEADGWASTPVYYGTRLQPGNVIAGPAIVQVPDTTIVVHPGQEATVDGFGNFLIRL